MTSAVMRFLVRQREMSLVAFIVLFLIILYATTPSFLAVSNLTDVISNISTLGIIAIGETFVIIGKGIDLSVGAIMGLSAIIAGNMATHGVPVILVLLFVILLGMIAGSLNGLFVSVFKIPPIIVTLASLGIYSGLMYLVTNGNWASNLPKSMGVFGGDIGKFPLPVLYLLIIVVLAWYFLSQTRYGRYIYGIGNNAATVRLAGIRTQRVEFLTYLLSGLLSAVAGLIYVSYYGIATPTTGTDLELQAIAAAVIGGTQVMGGRGSALGTLLGTVLIGIITSALVFYHLPSLWNEAVEGLIILLAVVLDATILKVGIKGAKA